ncbi:hypothetical protein V6N13_021851 [Hibiscus sabdariffa]
MVPASNLSTVAAIQGCGNNPFLRVTRQYVRDHRLDICVFVEPQISRCRADRVIASLGFPNSYRVEAIGFVGGIWLCWFDHIHIDILSCHFQYIHCSVVTDQISCLATFVYASPRFNLRSTCCSLLSSIATTISEPWIVFGDFNATLSTEDRNGCAQSSLPEPGFQNMVFDSGLSDLDYVGPDFTWYRGNCSVRLDRYFGNASWFERYPDSCLHHLLRMKSDHRPILLSFSGSSHHLHNKPFRYLSAWALHHDFDRLVHDNWDSSLPITDAIQSFTIAAQAWNRDIFEW